MLSVQPDAALFRMLAKSCEFVCENLDKDRTEDLGLAVSLQATIFTKNHKRCQSHCAYCAYTALAPT